MSFIERFIHYWRFYSRLYEELTCCTEPADSSPLPSADTALSHRYDSCRREREKARKEHERKKREIEIKRERLLTLV